MQIEGGPMKKAILILGLGLILLSSAQAAIVTNTNQSAAWIRMLSRNATTDIDAVYYNPAGLVKLTDGWHLYLANETIFQKKTVVNEFPLLNNGTYEGKVNVPIYPNVYVAWKKGNIAVSFGFGPNAGGGEADFKTGLPSFETGISMLAAGFRALGVSKYAADIAFKGSSIFLGYQANVSYALDDTFSLALGLRFITAKNTYTGHLSSINFNPNYPALGFTGAMISAKTFFQTLGTYGVLDPTTAAYYAAAVSDKSVDAKQTGSGLTPILSLHATPIPELNLSLRYEFNTKIELTNKTTADVNQMFPDGAKTRSDIPGFFALGADYALTPHFRASLSFSYYFDKSANWEGRQKLLDKNSYDAALGLEYDVTDMITVSAGYQRSSVSVTDNYQSDLSNDLSANTFGFGGRIKLNPSFDIDLGALIVSYEDYSKNIPYQALGASYRETYKRTTALFSIGVGYHFGGQVQE
jgi:long-chain fatty acid transport protein